MASPLVLVPIAQTAKTVVSKTDAPAFWTALLTLTPLPAAKTSDQIARLDLAPQADGSLSITAIFKSA